VSSPLVHLISTNPLFERLSDEQRLRACSFLSARRHDAGSSLDGAGFSVGRTYVLAAGTARVVRRDEAGRTVVVGLLEPGDMFGAIFGVGTGPREFVEALEPSTVLTLRTGGLAGLLAIDPLIAEVVMQQLSRRVADGADRLESLAQRTVPARFAVVLLDLAERRGRVTPTGVRIGLRITHGGLAELVATTRETVTKVAGWLRDEGIATHDRRQILIHDRARLVDVASGVLVMPGRSGGSHAPRLASRPRALRAS